MGTHQFHELHQIIPSKTMMKRTHLGSEIKQLDMGNWNCLGKIVLLDGGIDARREEVFLASPSEDEQGYLAKMPNDRALMVVDSNENLKAIAVDHSTRFDDEEPILLIEEKIIEITRVLGISIEESIGELLSFIREMAKVDKGRCKEDQKSKEKKKNIVAKRNRKVGIFC